LKVKNTKVDLTHEKPKDKKTKVNLPNESTRKTKRKVGLLWNNPQHTKGKVDLPKQNSIGIQEEADLNRSSKPLWVEPLPGPLLVSGEGAEFYEAGEVKTIRAVL
jgi:hypothetical protein